MLSAGFPATSTQVILLFVLYVAHSWIEDIWGLLMMYNDQGLLYIVNIKVEFVGPLSPTSIRVTSTFSARRCLPRWSLSVPFDPSKDSRDCER